MMDLGAKIFSLDFQAKPWPPPRVIPLILHHEIMRKISTKLDSFLTQKPDFWEVNKTRFYLEPLRKNKKNLQAFPSPKPWGV